MKGKGIIIKVILVVAGLVLGMVVGRKFGNQIPLLNKIQP
jgi:hypothetical protein